MLIIGENLHCSRYLKAGGPRCKQAPDGTLRISWREQGAERAFSAPKPAGAGRALHVALAVAAARGESQDAAAARDYLAHLARAQERAGAQYLDVNADQYSASAEANAAALAWLVSRLPEWTALPPALDSSDPRVLRAGLDVWGKRLPRPLLNSATAERPEVLEWAAREDCAVILSGAGSAAPADAEDRLRALAKVRHQAAAWRLPPARLFLDPLVLPLSVDTTQGKAFLEACRRLRQENGELHLVAGVSNVSFGLPWRELLNEVFLRLCQAAGLDAAILDPLCRARRWTPQQLAAAERLVRGEAEVAQDYLALARKN